MYIVAFKGGDIGGAREAQAPHFDSKVG